MSGSDAPLLTVIAPPAPRDREPPPYNRASASAAIVAFPAPAIPTVARLQPDAPACPHDYQALQGLLEVCVPETAILDSDGYLVLASRSWGARAGAASLRTADGRASVGFLSDDPATTRTIAARVAAVCASETAEAAVHYDTGTGHRRRHHRLRIAAFMVGNVRRVALGNWDVTEMHDLARDKRLLTEQLMRSEERERRRIAREMHDSTVQDLVAIGLNLKRLRHLDHDSVAQEVLGEVRDILSRIQGDVRTLSYLLHPPTLEKGGLVPALAELVRGLARRMEPRILFECDMPCIRCPAEIEMALYRVAQEGLMNVHKHAAASQVMVRCAHDAGRLVLDVEDDGVGFGARRGHEVDSGVGIPGMRARLRQLGGSLTVSHLDRGTRLRAVVPLKDPD